MARSRAVAAAVVWRAQMRATLYDFASNPDPGLAWVVAGSLDPAARVFRNATRFWRVVGMPGRIPVSRPLPDISDHVGEAKTVRRKRIDRRGAGITVARQILARKLTLPGVGHVAATWRYRIAPRKLSLVKSAARRILPFGFGREFLAGPGGVGFLIPVRDVHNGMVIETADRAALAIGAMPVGAEFDTPPVREGA